MAPLDGDGADLIHFPWSWERRTGVEKVMLQEMKLGGGMPAATLQRPGRLWTGLGVCLGLALGALGAAALSGKGPPDVPPVVVHWPQKPDNVWVSAETWNSAKRWRVTVATSRFLTARAALRGDQIVVKWKSQKLPCLMSLDPGSEIWFCGTVKTPPRLGEIHGPRVIALVSFPGAPGVMLSPSI